MTRKDYRDRFSGTYFNHYQRNKYWKWKEQDERCAMCHKKCPNPSKNRDKMLAQYGDYSVREHNHVTQQWTITHQKCNRQISSWRKDNVIFLINYLIIRDELNLFDFIIELMDYWKCDSHELIEKLEKYSGYQHNNVDLMEFFE